MSNSTNYLILALFLFSACSTPVSDTDSTKTKETGPAGTATRIAKNLVGPVQSAGTSCIAGARVPIIGGYDPLTGAALDVSLTKGEEVIFGGYSQSAPPSGWSRITTQRCGNPPTTATCEEWTGWVDSGYISCNNTKTPVLCNVCVPR